MSAYYNESDRKAAAWLRELIKSGVIAPGEVDDRDIREIKPSELDGFTQHHFFAGIGGWSYALRLAGWANERPVWTGSCPCQPFSAAGFGVGFADERHLWPAWQWLIDQYRPGVVFGEQVASKDGRVWFDLVSTDFEGMDYACGAVDTCSACIGAPHIRQRLYFVAHALRQQQHRGWQTGTQGRDESTVGGSARRLADTDGRNASAERLQRSREYGLLSPYSRPYSHSDTEWIDCTDGKARPVEPGSFPLAYGIPDRVGLLRSYGNAIDPRVAAMFIEATIT